MKNIFKYYDSCVRYKTTFTLCNVYLLSVENEINIIIYYVQGNYCYYKALVNWRATGVKRLRTPEVKDRHKMIRSIWYAYRFHSCTLDLGPQLHAWV